MQIPLFRCFETESKIWIFKDLSFDNPDAPEYIKMYQISGRYKITQWVGIDDVKGDLK
jgi:preprotein translocase subunit SecB